MSSLSYDFGYTIGRIRVLESYMLSSHQLERLIESRGIKEVYEVLSDTDFAQYFLQYPQSDDFETALNAGLVEVKQLLTSLLKDCDLSFLTLSESYQNYKIILKSFLRNEDLSLHRHLLSPLSDFSEEGLYRLIYEGKKEYGLREFTDTLLADFKKHESIFRIDQMIDEKYIEDSLLWAKKTHSSLFLSYMKSFIDRTNALMLVRGEKERFLSGGNISVSEYIHNGEMIFSQMFPHYSKTDLFVYLETEAKNALMDFVLQTRILASGIEPIIGFFLAKKNSAELIRSIIIGKIHNLPSEQIRKTLTKIY